MRDHWGRPLKDLRISVTDRCNFRCRYCMPAEIFDENYPYLPRQELLDFAEITRLVQIFSTLGVKKIRLTGGEPLLRKNLPDLIQMLNQITSIEEVALTTNGILLKKWASSLKQAGLKRVNVSLDTLDNQIFSHLNSPRHQVEQVMEGIEAASQVGLKVKINMVVIKGVNDHEIISFAQTFQQAGHMVRFIEYMDVGNTNQWKRKNVISKQEIIDKIAAYAAVQKKEKDHAGEVASRFQYLDKEGEFGVIPSITEPFCSTCTRARISANGGFYTCLFATSGTDLRSFLRSGASDQEIQHQIRLIWLARRDRYSEERSTLQKQTNRKKIEMSYIGG